MAAVDYFLKLDGIDGESTDDKHKGEIELHSFSWGATNEASSGSQGTGGGSGKVVFNPFTIHKTIDKSSPKLMLACASGEHIKKAVLTCRKAGKDQQEYLKITLSDVLVSVYEDAGGEEGHVIPRDRCSFNFGKIEFEYKPQKADGTLDSAVKAGWDLATNKKV